MQDRKSTKSKRSTIAVAIGFLAVTVLCGEAGAALSFNVEPNGWPNAAHRTAAVNAMQSVVNRYNAYGDFGALPGRECRAAPRHEQRDHCQRRYA